MTPESTVTVSAKLTAKSWAALERAATAAGDTRTDTINRAVQLYDQLADAAAQGAKVIVQWSDRDSEPVVVGEAAS